MSDIEIRRRKQENFNNMPKDKQNLNDSDNEDDVKERKGESFSRADIESIALLSVLYTLQGIPMGLSASVPLLLANKVGYSAQAIFSFCSWPFSLKLFWAPIVDSVYFPTMGRRKSWLVPVQMLCGIMMVAGSSQINTWIGDGDDIHAKPNTTALTTYFFILYFLMATQDIAVDGWALTMLSAGNVGYASTCNSVGQTLGYFIAFVGFIALNDPATCNKYLRSDHSDVGLVSLAGFIQFWGYIFLITTLFVWVFKPEASENKGSNHHDNYSYDSKKDDVEKLLKKKNNHLQYDKDSDENENEHDLRSHNEVHSQIPRHEMNIMNQSIIDEDNLGVLETYHLLWRVLKLSTIRKLCLVLLTCKISFAVTDAATTLKFIEYGVPKEQLAYFAPAFVGIGILVPLLVGRFTNGPRPLTIFLIGVPLRIISGVFLAFMLNYTKTVFGQGSGGDPGNTFWALFLLTSAFNNVAMNLMFVAQMSFFAQVSDPAIGGTYMTLLNTIANLGSKWPTSTSLALLDSMTYKTCQVPVALSATLKLSEIESFGSLDCSFDGESNACLDKGGVCNTTTDGYMTQLVLCTCLGILWLIVFTQRILQLEKTPKSKWTISNQ